MNILQGEGIFAGIVEGPVFLLSDTGNRTPERRIVSDSRTEQNRLENAVHETESLIDATYQKSKKTVDKETSEIFEIHKMMLTDPDFIEPVQQMIETDKVNCEYAVSVCSDRLAEDFRQLEDEYMKARAADIIDVSRQLLSVLEGKTDLVTLCCPSIVAGDDFTPSQTMQWDRTLLLGIILKNGSPTSHVSILARSRGIPCIISLKENFSLLKTGQNLIMDGAGGTVIIDANSAVKERYHILRTGQLKQKEEDIKSACREAVTPGGKKIGVYANISRAADAAGAVRCGADGIGLFRSEFLYMQQNEAPTEDLQFDEYKAVITAMQGKTVIIRTLDIGADKQVPYLAIGKEENPALGQRAIRLCLKRKDLFKTQLRALLRAAVFGDLRIMFPMITSLEEVRTAKKLLREAKEELAERGIKAGTNVKTGIMIETPAAALISGELASEADFFSIGTNDLTQYTLAADRVNPEVAGIYSQRHPAVLKLIEMTVRNAKKNGIETGVCGESAGDPELLPFFLSLGINELSVNQAVIPELKNRIRNIRTD
jgi:phosphoenolpyruvate-protein phosphotransferase (PTS system enzyme I)